MERERVHVLQVLETETCYTLRQDYGYTAAGATRPSGLWEGQWTAATRGSDHGNIAGGCVCDCVILFGRGLHVRVGAIMSFYTFP